MTTIREAAAEPIDIDPEPMCLHPEETPVRIGYHVAWQCDACGCITTVGDDMRGWGQ